MPIRKTNMDKKQFPAGMCPYMVRTETAKAKTKRKKPNPYKAPTSVKRYYDGIAYGIDVLRDDLLSKIEDEELKTLITGRARTMKLVSSNKLARMEKEKTKKKMLEWEEKEWEHI